MKISNLAQLKRALQTGARFRVIRHFKPELCDTVREVDTVQTNAVYLKMAGQPEHPISVCNGGKGSFMPFFKAPHYTFGETVRVYGIPGSEASFLYEFAMLDSEVAA